MFDQYGNWTDDDPTQSNVLQADQDQEDIARLEHGQPEQLPPGEVYNVPSNSTGSNQGPDQSYFPSQQMDRGEDVLDFSGQYSDTPPPEPAEPYRKHVGGGKWVGQDDPRSPVPMGQQAGQQPQRLNFRNPMTGKTGSIELPPGPDGQRLQQDYQRRGYQVQTGPGMQFQQPQQQREPSAQDLQSILDRTALSPDEQKEMGQLQSQMRREMARTDLLPIDKSRLAAQFKAQLEPLQQRANQAKQIALKLADQQMKEQTAKEHALKTIGGKMDMDAHIENTKKWLDFAQKNMIKLPDGTMLIPDQKGTFHEHKPHDVPAEAQIREMEMPDGTKVSVFDDGKGHMKVMPKGGATTRSHANESFDYKKHLEQSRAQAESDIAGEGGTDRWIPGKGADGKPSDKMVENPAFRNAVEKRAAEYMKMRRADHDKAHAEQQGAVAAQVQPGQAQQPQVDQSRPGQDATMPANDPERLMRQNSQTMEDLTNFQNYHKQRLNPGAPNDYANKHASEMIDDSQKLIGYMRKYPNIAAAPPEVQKDVDAMRKKIEDDNRARNTVR